MKYYKYENVDVIAFLEEKMKNNTKHYQSDFKYDIEMFENESKSQNGHNVLLWLSRESGTHCMYEKDVFIKNTAGNTTWKYFENYDPDEFLAFAVEITGVEDGVIKGNCYHLDYMAHIQEVKNKEVNSTEKIITFSDDHKEKLSSPYYFHTTASLCSDHGAIVSTVYLPDDMQEFSDVIKEQADKRKAMKPYKRLSLDEQLKSVESRKNNSSPNKENLEKNNEPTL